MSKLDISVLYVEDDQFERLYWSKFLENKVKKVYIGKSGSEGLKKYKQYRPDIIISDIQMPVMNGLEMIKKIKEVDKDAKTIIVTGISEVKYFVEAFESGINGYLLKPIDRTKLSKLIIEIAQSLEEGYQPVDDNITRKRIEETLSESENLYKALLRQSHDMIFVFWRDKILFINKRATEILGYTERDFYEKEIWNFIHPTDKERITRMGKFLFTSQRILDKIETSVISKDGSIVHIDVGLNMIEYRNKRAILGTARDVTARKKAEEALIKSEERYRTLFECAGDAIFISNVSGSFVEVNQVACERLGYTREELLKKGTLDIDISKKEVILKKSKEIFEGEGSSSFETVHITKNGEKKPVEIISIIIEYKGEPCILSTARDITQQKLAREKLMKSLKEKEVLLKEVHHRVKNNMQVISSILSLQAKTVKNPIIRGYMEESQDRIRTMALVHENLYKTKSFSDIDFSDYIKKLTNNIFRSYGVDRSKIMINFDIDKVYLTLDVGIPCGLIINELISNAIKYAFVDRDKGKITICLKKSGDKKLKLAVKDNGVGISKIIDFKNTATLGLQLVTTLSDQIGGKIKLIRKEGTEFQILFKM